MGPGAKRRTRQENQDKNTGQRGFLFFSGGKEASSSAWLLLDFISFNPPEPDFAFIGG